MVERLKHDLCIIGAGAGGLALATAAAAMGVPVVLVEKGRPGGNLWTGTVPSKAFIAAARTAAAIRRSAAFGIDAQLGPIDFKRVRQHVSDAVATFAPDHAPERLAAMGIRLVTGEARFVDRRTLAVDDIEIRARRFVIATGTVPFIPQAPGLEDIRYLTPETIYEQQRLPDHLIVVGGGATGMEMAQAHRRLGAEVTVIEAYSALGREDPEMAAVVLRALKAEGVTVLENAKIQGIEKMSKGGVRVHLAAGTAQRTVEGTHVLIAAGRRPNVAELGLDKARVAHDRKAVKVSARLRTTNPRIYAIGDVTGARHHAHLAPYHAALLVKPLLFKLPRSENRSGVPYVIFTDPEIAHVGLTEEEAEARHGKVHVYRWPYAENERAQAERTPEGHFKIMTDEAGTIVGATIAGADAGELIGLWTLAVGKGLSLDDVAAFMPAYPTLGDIGKRALQGRAASSARKLLPRAASRILRRLG